MGFQRTLKIKARRHSLTRGEDTRLQSSYALQVRRARARCPVGNHLGPNGTRAQGGGVQTFRQPLLHSKVHKIQVGSLIYELCQARDPPSPSPKTCATSTRLRKHVPTKPIHLDARLHEMIVRTWVGVAKRWRRFMTHRDTHRCCATCRHARI